jgi:DedD protein
MADNAEVLDLRRRARRRLIGAIALVLALVIVPPWLMDLEPRPVTTDLRVEIPAQDTNRLKPPPAAAAKAPEAAPAPAAEPAKPDAAPKAEAKPAPVQLAADKP